MDQLSQAESQAGMPAMYQFETYHLCRKFFKLIGAQVDVFAPNGQQVLCCKQKAFKLKEDIRIFTDESQRTELLTIKARNIIDFSAAYDVHDAQTGEHLGVLRRKGFSSIIRDEWQVLDPREQQIATIQEDNMLLALIRRFLTDLVPQSFNFTAMTGQQLGAAHQRFNPFIQKMDITMPTGDQTKLLDPRMMLAACMLLVLIEGRQS